MKYVAFLRGINVGGHTLMKMEDLRGIFEKLGYTNVKTVLASGNVIFEATEKQETNLIKEIETTLQEKFQKEIHVILRSETEIKNLIAADPFYDIVVTPDTRRYVTFLATSPKASLSIPYSSPEGEFTITKIIDRDIISVLVLTPNIRTTEVMSILEKTYGKYVTTRNWNTVLKLFK